MCGIAGKLDITGSRIPDTKVLWSMIAPQRHRGPDGVGFLRAPGIGMAHTRLSIIDLEGGWQPLSNEDRTVWITYNGEIFNFQEIRDRLKAAGHIFSTNTDTEVLVHLFEDKGMSGMLDELNGQYSFALWDRRGDAGSGTLYLARDHVGIHPLHYMENDGWFHFSSEVKGLMPAAGTGMKIDHLSLDQLFTFWGPLSGRSMFQGVREVPPGHYLKVSSSGSRLVKYWDVPFSSHEKKEEKSLAGFAEELEWLLDDAVRLRLIADVPVGAYLSGGLDSSVVTALTRKHNREHLRTFSVAFDDEDFDESRYQRLLNDNLKTDNSSVTIKGDNIRDAFEDVIWHSEKPVLRTAPTPMFLLSGSVREAGFKTVLTGEGADEFLGGYDIYKEAALRAFWLRNPDSPARASLFRKLYPYIKSFSSRPVDYLREYFKMPAPGWDDLFSSHWVRWMVTSRIKRFYDSGFCEHLNGYDPVIDLQDRTREKLAGLDVLSRAQYLEISTLLPNYLLSSQGDRMAMAHSVEARFPFLDKRVIDFSCRIPSWCKLMGLNEKAVLKRSMRGRLPAQIVRRHKRPYMAPDIPSFMDEKGGFTDIVSEHLSEYNIRSSGIFKAPMVTNLLKKCESGRAIGFGDSMTLVGILSTQVWLDRFAGSAPVPMPYDEKAVKVNVLINGGNNGSDR